MSPDSRPDRELDERRRPTPSSPISVTRREEIEVRGHRLAADLIGNVSFTEMFLLDLDGELPSRSRLRVVDAVLVTLMEHGTTPSSLSTRLALEGAPESLQGAIAAGLLATGSRFLGTVDRVAASVQKIVSSEGDIDAGAAAEVDRLIAAGDPVPGVGHNLHPELDPRVEMIFGVLRHERFYGQHVEALLAMHRCAVDRVGRDLTLNAAGAIGAALSELEYSPEEVRGFAVVSRCAGLFAHVVDERRSPIAREVWQGVHERLNHPPDEAEPA